MSSRTRGSGRVKTRTPTSARRARSGPLSLPAWLQLAQAIGGSVSRTYASDGDRIGNHLPKRACTGIGISPLVPHHHRRHRG